VAKKVEGDPRGFNPKLRAITELYNQFDGTQTMVFLNTKKYVT
jgi:hypothetical protein